MHKIYTGLAAMGLAELQKLFRQLEFHSDPWAESARKMVAWEIRCEKRAAVMRSKTVFHTGTAT